MAAGFRMLKEQVKRIVVEYQERMPFALFPRSTPTLVGTRQIHAVVGLRRVGKTHFLYQIVNALLTRGVAKERILFINFEDERLADITAGQLGLVLDAYLELYPAHTTGEVHVFFDEIQAAPGWERFVARLFEEKRYRLAVSGSSSKLLAKELATALRGRSIATRLYPLSFRELAAYRGIAVDEKLAYSRARFATAKLLDEYVQWGGFFEVANASSVDERRRIVQTYLDLVVYKDIVERYGVKNVSVLKRLIRYFVTNTTRKASLLRLSQTLAERVSKNTVQQYTGLLEDCGFLFPVGKFSHSLRRGNTPSKYYIADPCFKTVAGLNFSEDRGALYESAVFLELVRRGDEPFFYEDKGECDFVVKRDLKIAEAIQVCVDPRGQERELRGLLGALHAFGLARGTIITAEQDGEERVDGRIVRYVPLWRWLLLGGAHEG
jgi:uncharacterized protein